MSLPAPASRDQCIAEMAQLRADLHVKFWTWVREIGTEAAAEALDAPWRALTRQELKEWMDAQLAGARVPARTGAA